MADLSDEERYRLTHELFMLSEMRFRGTVELDGRAAMKREDELIKKLGYQSQENSYG